MSEDLEVKSIRILEFTGDEAEWEEWSTKTEAIFSVRGWDDAIDNTKDLPKGSSFTSEEKELLKANKAAYNYLLLSCKGDAFKLVRNKEKHAGRSWANLKATYHMSKKLDYLTLSSKLNTCVMEDPTACPSTWFSELEFLQQQIEEIRPGKVTNEDLLLQVALRLPRDVYSAYITTLLSDLKNKKYKKVKEEVLTIYRGQIKDMNDKDKMVFLLYKKFKGTCRKCGKQGHKAVDCPTKDDKNKNDRNRNFGNRNGRRDNNFNHCNNDRNNGNRGNKPPPKCYSCGETGHISPNCPNKKKEANAFFLGHIEMEMGDCLSREEATDNEDNVENEFGTNNEAVNESTSLIDDNDDPSNSIAGNDDNDDETVAESFYNDSAKRIDDEIANMWRMVAIGAGKINDDKLLCSHYLAVAIQQVEDALDNAHLEQAQFGERLLENPTSENLILYQASKRHTNYVQSILERLNSISVDSDNPEHPEVPQSMFTTNEYNFITGNYELHNIKKNTVTYLQSGEEGMLVDTGANCHCTNDDTHLTNARFSTDPLTIGDKRGKLSIEKEGNLQIQIGKDTILLCRVQYSPHISRNILSVPCLVDNGWIAHFEKSGSYLQISGKRIPLHQTSNRLWVLPPNLEMHDVEKKKKVTFADESPQEQSLKPLNINDAHDKCGHVNENTLRRTYRDAGFKLTGKLKACNPCLRAKAKVKGVPKKTDTKTTLPGRRFGIDISGPYESTSAGPRYWIKVVDFASHYSWDWF